MANLPSSIETFLRRNIDSVEQLEILLWLRKVSRPCTAEEVNRHMATSLSSVTSRLRGLEEAALVKRASDGPTTVYVYEPDDRRTAADIDLLADLYRSHRVRIISLLFSKPDDSLRNLSDAFRLRKRKQD